MKKSLVALAVLAASGAYAQSSVTLYGIVEATTDIGYNKNLDTRTTVNDFNAGNVLTGTSVNATTARQKNNFRVQDGSDQGTGTSRVGFRGTEDLGGGLKANFVLEMGLRSDDGCTTLGAVTTGAARAAPNTAVGTTCNNGGGSADSGGSTFGRNAWGGLSGSFGEVRLGRQVLGSYGVQANSVAAGAGLGLYESSAAGYGPTAIGGVRFSNAIRYMSPDLGGFKGSVMVAAPETGSNTFNAPGNNIASRRTGVDLALEYANGPAYIGFGYNKRDLGNVTSVTTGALTVNTSPGTVTGYTIGGAYDLGVVKPFVNYTRVTTNSSGSTLPDPLLANITGSNSSNSNARALSVGLRAPVGAFTVIAGYGRVNTDVNSASVVSAPTTVSTFTSTAGQERRDAFQVGAQYALSKRTLVEANYGYSKLRTNGTAVETRNGAPFLPAGPGGRQERFTDSNERISAFNVGLKHSF